MGQERRSHPRVAISVDVDFSSGSNFYTGRTRDISVGGLFIETAVGLPVGSEIAVRLRISGREFSVHGEVTWALLDLSGTQTGVGVRFLDLDAEARATIDDFMKERPPMDFDSEPVLEDDEPPGGPPPLPKN
jgi:uncharacterized protein (TIGR02266 family)